MGIELTAYILMVNYTEEICLKWDSSQDIEVQSWRISPWSSLAAKEKGSRNVRKQDTHRLPRKEKKKLWKQGVAKYSGDSLLSANCCEEFFLLYSELYASFLKRPYFINTMIML